jgi:lipid-binding SYLF domain-containing protein
VFLAYDAKASKWGGPAFYTIGEVSFGLQADREASEVVLVALTERGERGALSRGDDIDRKSDCESSRDPQA